MKRMQLRFLFSELSIADKKRVPAEPTRPDNGRNTRAGLRISNFVCAIASIIVCVNLTGCFGFLKPARSTARHFVLTPILSDKAAADAPRNLGVGIGQVKVPAYLFDSSLAVRTATNEIAYLATVLWAERLDNGLQRVLASNLANLLPSDLVRMSAWRSDDVSAEVYVTVSQFDVDQSGQGVLATRWRILAPGGEKVLKAGGSQFSRKGPSPETDPSGAVGTLSDLVGDLSRQLAQSLKEVVMASGK
jgi:uncharacterized lipoprotein YmbA